MESKGSNMSNVKFYKYLMNITFLSRDDDHVFYITASGATITYGYFFACVLTTVLAGWIIFLNALVIHTLLFHKKHPVVTDYFVSSLSIADLVTGIHLLYVTSYSLAQYQNFWECLFRFGLTYGISQSSFNHIFAITLDRYVKIIYPLRYFAMFSKKSVILISTAIWTISILIGLLPLLGWHKQFETGENSETVCRFFGVLPDSYFIFNFLTSMGTSGGMLIMYGRIIHEALRKQKEMKHLMEGYQPPMARLDDQAWRLVKTVAIIVLISNMCWFPGVLVIALHIFQHLDHLSYEHKGDLITYCGLAVFLNSLINPLIYAAKIEEVKRRFSSIFCCSKPQMRRMRTLSTQEAIQSSEV